MTIPTSSKQLISLSKQPCQALALPSERDELETHVLECLTFFQAPLTTIEHTYAHYYPIPKPDPLTVPGVDSVSSPSTSTMFSFEFEGEETPTESEAPRCTEYLLSLSDPDYEYEPASFLSPSTRLSFSPLHSPPHRSFLFEVGCLTTDASLDVLQEPLFGQLSLFDHRARSFCSESFDFDLFSNVSHPLTFSTDTLPAYAPPREDLPIRRALLPIPHNQDLGRFSVLLVLRRVLSGDSSKAREAYTSLVEEGSSEVGKLYQSSLNTGLFREIFTVGVVNIATIVGPDGSLDVNSVKLNHVLHKTPLYYISSNLSLSDLEPSDFDDLYGVLIDAITSSNLDSSKKLGFRVIPSFLSLSFGLSEVNPTSIDRIDCMQRRYPSGFNSSQIGFEPNQPTRVLHPLGRTWPASVFTDFFHFVQVTINAVSLEGILASNSARNIAIKFDLRSGDMNTPEESLPHFFHQNQLCDHVIAPVVYHSKSHPLQFFVKLFLPLALKDSHHLFVQLLHVFLQTKSSKTS
ncbi:hypothetical protein GEMRC1_005681 [Eukaryota sp. GEM-RC1]